LPAPEQQQAVHLPGSSLTGSRTPSRLIQVRPLQEQDLAVVADLLVRSFRLYPPGGEWLIPIVRVGIQEDLRLRIQSRQYQTKYQNQIKQYQCLVASVGQPTAAPPEIVGTEIVGTEIVGTEIVGTVEVSQRLPFLWPMTRPYAYLANLAVRSEYRQQGIAQALIRASEVQVMGWNCQDLYLHVMEDNLSARQLYLKAGYYIHQVENTWSSCLGQPQRLFLHKRLGHHTQATV
jgi:ribosomal protein S18 acetylase RimI-like enzyme